MDKEQHNYLYLSKSSTKILACIIFLFVLLSICLNAQALDKKYIRDNQTIMVKISAKEITRIFIDNDRILSMRGQEGSYIVKNDPTLGHIYIQPTENYQNKSFTVFLTTEQGRSFTLFLVPIDVPAQVVELIPQTPAKKEAVAWESLTAYEHTITRLILAMKNGKTPNGYVVVSNGIKTAAINNGNKIQVNLISSYLGANLHGEILRIKNNSSKSINLVLKDFYDANTRALSLDDTALAPHTTTLLYRVLSNGGKQ